MSLLWNDDLSFLYSGIGICEKTGSFYLQKEQEVEKLSRAKNPKYESMSLEELRANMEKSKKELEHAIHNKNILEQRKEDSGAKGTFPQIDC